MNCRWRIFQKAQVQSGLLILLVLGGYYPALFVGETLVDDRKMLMLLDDLTRVDAVQVFSSYGSGLYYRPLTVLTFMYDKLWWNLDPGFMHLENILLHLFNAVLVYIGVRLAARRFGWDFSLLPFTTALLFALHPVNVEAVVWISGRTDLLATVFILSSLIVAMLAAERSSFLLAVAAVLILVAGGTAKETALFAAPVLLAVLWLSAPERCVARRLVAAALLPCSVAAVAYLAFRSGNFGALDQGFQLLAKGMARYPWYDVPRVVFKVTGFYIKKLFVPHPLNFAIVSVSGWYVLLGIASIVAVPCFVWKRRSPVALLMGFSLVLLMPALVVAFIGIAWTPLAERYLYQPTIFWSLAMALALSIFLKQRQLLDWFLPVSILIVLPMTLATANRVILWGDPVAFYADTLKKSPQFNTLRNELGLALAEQGQKEAAEKQYDMAIANDPSARNVLYYTGRALLLSNQGKDEEARRFLRETMRKNPSAGNVELYKALLRIDFKLVHEGSHLQVSLVDELNREMLDALQHVYAIEKNPFYLYRAGQIALQLKEQRRAADFFGVACREASPDTHYRDAACKLSERLSGVAQK